MIGTICFAAVALLVTAFAALYLYNIIKWADYPDFGYGWRSATGIEIVGLVTEPGRRAGMQVGDRILKVNGKPFSNIDEFRSAMRRNLGETNTYLLEREGQKIEVTIANSPLGFMRSFGKSGFPFVLGLCYALIGALVFLMKPNRRASWIFFISASGVISSAELNCLTSRLPFF